MILSKDSPVSFTHFLTQLGQVGIALHVIASHCIHPSRCFYHLLALLNIKVNSPHFTLPVEQTRCHFLGVEWIDLYACILTCIPILFEYLPELVSSSSDFLFGVISDSKMALFDWFYLFLLQSEFISLICCISMVTWKPITSLVLIRSRLVMIWRCVSISASWSPSLPIISLMIFIAVRRWLNCQEPSSLLS